MDKYDIYKGIAERTGGDIYVGVVGPVRTGKSTFITKFMEKSVLPNISGKLNKQIATDEMPQSADGKTVMTTQPKFVPANAVKVTFKNKTTANVRLVDCVGYMVKGANGHEENGKPRLVKTPWDEKEIPFEKAAEIGTEKVINDYSTIGVVITTDGSFGEIDREAFVLSEEKTVKELIALKKPFVIVLNSAHPSQTETVNLAAELEEKYDVPVLAVNVLEMDSEDVGGIIEKILLEFPMCAFNVEIPKWLQRLPADSPVIEELIKAIKEKSRSVNKMKDYVCLTECFSDSERFNPMTVKELKTGEGVSEFSVCGKEGLFYNVLSEECGEEIKDECELMGFIKSFSNSRREYVKVKDALKAAYESGYGVVSPSLDEMNLEEPVLVKQGGRYGVKLKASAPSLHIMKVDVSTEVSPIVGTEKQGEDLINYLMGQFEDNPSGIWETNMFGKSLHDLVKEGLQSKIDTMPKDAQGKMRKTVTRIVNENKGGVICILL